MEYSFINVFKCVENIYSDAISGENMYPDAGDRLAKALNDFFKDFRCKEVIINKNTDKPLFGIFLKPSGKMPNDVVNSMFNDYIDSSQYFEPFKYDSYYLELDMRVFRDLEFTIEEATAMILNHVNQMNSPGPIKYVRDIIDRYIAEKDIYFNLENIQQFSPVFDMVLNITLNNIVSIFNIISEFDNPVVADIPTFLRDYGQGLDDAFRSLATKIYSHSEHNLQYDTKLILMSWYFNNYRDLVNNRWIENMLRTSMETEASILVKRMILAAFNSLTEINSDDIRYFSSITESAKKRGLIYKIKRDGIKSIEEDLFEYQMRLQNVETQDEAILLMRQLNSRMSILEDYLRDEDLDDVDRERWERCYAGYIKVRDTLSKKTIYNKKMYGLFVDYNALQQMSQNGQLNTYY